MQAGLNVMREQLRLSGQSRLALSEDKDLRAVSPTHWQCLMDQMATDANELRAAISLVERVMDGRLIEVSGGSDSAPVGAWAQARPRRLVKGTAA